MNQQNAATPVNYLNPEKNNLYAFPSTNTTPSMAAPVPMPEAKYQNDSETDAVITHTFINFGWAALVMVLALVCNIITIDMMGSSLITNMVLTAGACWKKSSKMAKFVTDINLGFVLLSIIAFIGKMVF